MVIKPSQVQAHCDGCGQRSLSYPLGAEPALRGWLRLQGWVFQTQPTRLLCPGCKDRQVLPPVHLPGVR